MNFAFPRNYTKSALELRFYWIVYDFECKLDPYDAFGCSGGMVIGIVMRMVMENN